MVQRLDLIKGVHSKIRLYMRTFSIIPDSTRKIYKEMIVLDGVPDFHPPYYGSYYVIRVGGGEVSRLCLIMGERGGLNGVKI